MPMIHGRGGDGNPVPDTQQTQFTILDVRGLQSTGTSTMTWEYNPYRSISGPAIIKVNCIASAADIDMTAGFSGVVVDI